MPRFHVEALDKGAVMTGLQPCFHGCCHERVAHCASMSLDFSKARF